MMKCPKCGFSQPKDKYCANCGIDIEIYRPPRRSPLSGIFSGTSVMAFCLLVGAALLFRLYVPLSNMSKRTSKNAKSSVFSSERNMNADKPNGSGLIASGESGGKQGNNSQNAYPENLPNTKGRTDSNGENENDLDSPNGQSRIGGFDQGKPGANRGINSEGELNGKAVGDGRASDSKANEIGVASIENGKFSVRIDYAEVKTSDLPQLFEEAQKAGQFLSYRDHQSGVLPQVAPKLKNSPIIKIYHSEDKDVEPGKPIQWFHGARSTQDPSSSVGFMFSLEISRDALTSSGQSVLTNFDIARNWRGGDGREPAESGAGTSGSVPPASGISNVTFPPISADLDRQAVLFVSGAIPHRVAADIEDRLLSDDALRILKYNTFSTQKTESVFFIHLNERQKSIK